MVNSPQIQRTVARVLFPFFLFASLVVPQRAYAVLPALAFAEIVGTVVESFVIRSAARQVIATVGTAANDATWASTFSSWLSVARPIASIVFNVSNYQGASVPITQIEVPVLQSASTDLTVGASDFVYFADISAGTYIPSGWALDGHRHDPPQTVNGTTVSAALSALIAWWNPLAIADVHLTAGGCFVDSMGRDACHTAIAANGSDYVVVFTGANREQADGVGRIVGVPGGWAADSTDPDWTPAQKSAINSVEALRFRGVVSSGQNAVIDLVPEGSALRVRYIETVSYSYVRERNALTDTSFAPVAYDESNYQGVIEAAPTSTSTTTNTASVVFPTDYARQGEAQAAAQSINAKLDSVTGGFTSPASGVDMAATLDARIAAVSGVASTVPVIDWMPSLMPGTVTACTPIPINGNVTGGLLNGMVGSAELDICDKLDILRQFFGYLFMIGATVYIFRVFTRSNSTGA